MVKSSSEELAKATISESLAQLFDPFQQSRTKDVDVPLEKIHH